METAPTSIEVLLRPTLGQSDEPSDLRGSLSPTSVYSTWQSPGGHPSNYEPGATSPNFSDRANHDERTPYSVYLHCNNFLMWFCIGSPSCVCSAEINEAWQTIHTQSEYIFLINYWYSKFDQQRGEWVNIALRRSLYTSIVIWRQKKARTMPYSYQMTSRVLYGAQYQLVKW